MGKVVADKSFPSYKTHFEEQRSLEDEISFQGSAYGSRYLARGL